MATNKIVDTGVFQDTRQIVSLKLHESQFKNAKGFYGTITRNTADMDNIVARISKKDTGVSDYTVKHVICLLRDEIINTLRSGQSIDMFGLGQIYFAPDGLIKGDKPNAAAVPRIVPRCTLSALSNEIESGLRVDRMEFGTGGPCIEGITDLYTGEEGLTLTAGMSVWITGRKLKIGGEGGGIYLMPVLPDEEKSAVPDESAWLEAGRIIRNHPRTLEFFLPRELVPGEYRIALRTAYNGNGASMRKNMVTACSKVVTVTAQA